MKRGVRQGYSLSPLIFNCYIEKVIIRVELKEQQQEYRRNINVGGTQISMIRFSDGIGLYISYISFHRNVKPYKKNTKWTYIWKNLKKI